MAPLTYLLSACLALCASAASLPTTTPFDCVTSCRSAVAHMGPSAVSACTRGCEAEMHAITMRAPSFPAFEHASKKPAHVLKARDSTDPISDPSEDPNTYAVPLHIYSHGPAVFDPDMWVTDEDTEGTSVHSRSARDTTFGDLFGEEDHIPHSWQLPGSEEGDDANYVHSRSARSFWDSIGDAVTSAYDKASGEVTSG
eukprot:comp9551_c0_seq1/m.4573 comp9551_c0_seq1/g.4573  ORF comp9551_c0_seq1/g.4573 comp9551_c0_seq1/m.4573 type:complete len:198 (-) comp9551_c0_seq1:81-674(-)